MGIVFEIEYNIHNNETEIGYMMKTECRSLTNKKQVKWNKLLVRTSAKINIVKWAQFGVFAGRSWNWKFKKQYISRNNQQRRLEIRLLWEFPRYIWEDKHLSKSVFLLESELTPPLLPNYS